MAKFFQLLFVMLLATVVASANIKKEEKKCSPWLGYCTVYEDCCRNLDCAFYSAKCVPIYGVIVPGKDERPIGDGPFPPVPGQLTSENTVDVKLE